MVDKHVYARAIEPRSQLGARLVLTYNRSTISGRPYCISPRGGRISRSHVRPLDSGLFPERPQSWELEKRRY
jgi:hypothetical protein